MKKLLKYRIYCITESAYVYTWKETTPTVCPNNNSHTIDSNTISQLDKIQENRIEILEEQPTAEATDGRFRCDGFEISAIANSITQKDFSWPYPVSALLLRFISEETHRGDYINCYGKPTTFLSNLNLDITPNTTVLPVVSTIPLSIGMSIVITDSINTESLGKITNKDTENSTVTVQTSTQFAYNKNAYISYYNPVGIVTNTVTAGDVKIVCNSTVIQNVKKGMILYIYDSINEEKLGEVFDVNKITNTITIQDSPSNSYSVGSYLRVVLHMIKNYKLGPPASHLIGDGKIGGSYILPFHIISIEYTNNSVNTTKDFNWYTEVLY